MEFQFPVVEVLPNEITRLTSRSCNANYRYHRQTFNPLKTVIDSLGAASSKAQGLNHVITTWDKFCVSDHILFILKDISADNKVIGFIKIGCKKLFVLDENGNHNEMYPLCVLDFYVCEAQQRKGFGRKLLDCILYDQKVSPKHLAIDRPSAQFRGLLSKHYGMSNVIPQINNFAVFQGFFDSRDDELIKWEGFSRPIGKNARNGLPYVHRPQSQQSQSRLDLSAARLTDRVPLGTLNYNSSRNTRNPFFQQNESFTGSMRSVSSTPVKLQSFSRHMCNSPAVQPNAMDPQPSGSRNSLSPYKSESIANYAPVNGHSYQHDNMLLNNTSPPKNSNQFNPHSSNFSTQSKEQSSSLIQRPKSDNHSLYNTVVSSHGLTRRIDAPRQERSYSALTPLGAVEVPQNPPFRQQRNYTITRLW